jgi:hypothetical protein
LILWKWCRQHKQSTNTANQPNNFFFFSLWLCSLECA